jgi:hypothetical protein
VILTIIVDQVLHVVKDHKQSIKLRRWETLIQTYKGYPLKKYKSSKTLTCLTTWEQTNGRQVLLAYDPRSQTLVLLMLRQELTEVTKTFLCSMATLQL